LEKWRSWRRAGRADRGAAPAGAAPGAAPGPGRGTPPAIPADPKWTLYGPGLDYDYDRQNGGNVEDRGTPRRELAWRGGIVLAEAGKRPRMIGSLGDPDALMALITPTNGINFTSSRGAASSRTSSTAT
jgi:hypothetical protein